MVHLECSDEENSENGIFMNIITLIHSLGYLIIIDFKYRYILVISAKVPRTKWLQQSQNFIQSPFTVHSTILVLILLAK